MVDRARRARILRDLRQDFIPDYDARSLPSAAKRAAFALKKSACLAGMMRTSKPLHEQSLGKSPWCFAASKRHFSDAAWFSIPSKGL